MSEGLTQDDFRRLMATPRRPTEEQEFKAPAPKTPRNAAVFAQPRAMRKKNNFKRKQPEKKQEDDDEEEEQDKSNYRDRAAERRQQEQGQQPELEPDQDVDHMLLYQQSKLLGGDIDNTHLVKGLDFALLNKVRSNLLHKEQEPEQETTADEEMDDTDLEQVFDKFERGEKITEEEEEPQAEEKVNEPKFHSLMAKNIFELIDQDTKNELFEPGRMAYVFELADEVGHYSDAFHIPTAMIRSKTDVAAKLARSGWSEDTQAESNLIIERISKIMKGKRLDEAKPEMIKKSTTMTSEPIAMVEDGFMGDIFADAGRDYELDESTISSTTAVQKGSYFDTVDDEEEDVEMQENEQVNALLSKATTNTNEEQNNAKRRKTATVTDMDADAADIDMFGLSSSALPTSFADHQTTAYQSDDDTIQMVDQGTNRNKKAQLTRWDFDTEEEWQNYKDTIEIQPKSAYQFGVKLGDGRKRNRERKGMNDKQKLNREYQQVKNIMDKKYGKK